jgi:meso-butanediol dehydrogenase/(S,S)-butanediol dehydrogenase/diacetyl reductase
MAGRTVVVTGGASGIGLGISKGLAAEGANLVIADLNVEDAQKAADAITQSGGNAIAAHVDVTNRISVAAGIERAVKEFGKLDCYFNNAGFNKPMKFLDVTEENFNMIMSVNALAVFVGTQEAAKQYIRQGTGGKVVNTASIAGRTGFSSFAPYSASKAAVISITQADASALAEHNTKLDKDLEDIGEGDSGFDSMAAGILVGRAAQPEDIVPTALFLASSDSDYVTGQTMAIDGGMILV